MRLWEKKSTFMLSGMLYQIKKNKLMLVKTERTIAVTLLSWFDSLIRGGIEYEHGDPTIHLRDGTVNSSPITVVLFFGYKIVSLSILRLYCHIYICSLLQYCVSYYFITENVPLTTICTIEIFFLPFHFYFWS